MAEAMQTQTLGLTFEPEQVTRFWQQSTTRLIRANERLLHGFMSAATRELELSLELTRYNLSKLQTFANGANPSEPKAAEADSKEFEHIVAGLREVSEEILKTFGDASSLLLEGSLTEAPATIVEPLKRAANP